MDEKLQLITNIQTRILNRYNPERDLAPVSATEMDLLEMILKLIDAVNDLTLRVHNLEAGDVEDMETTNDIYRECCG